jgi:mycothiol synthase
MQDPEGSVSWRTVIDRDWSGARRFLNARGYSPAQDVLIMRRKVVPNPVVSLPDGFRLRDAVSSVDAETVTRLYNTANRRSFGFAPLAVDELSETLETPGGRLLVVVDPQDEIVGSTQTLPGFNSVGILHAIQVLPEFQGRGLGKFLVAAAIDVLTRSGFRLVELSVDARNTLAVDMYRKLGFYEWSRDSVFEKDSQ